MPLFDRIVPLYMDKLMADFDCSAEDAAAVFGNAGHESAGFETLQERRPVVPGSRGGYGWFQWTGPRRRAFEAYCARNGYDPRAPEANYKFLWVELNGPERRTMPAVKAARGLHAKTRIFEQRFERAGIKHYASRIRWAERALAAWRSRQRTTKPAPPGMPPDVPPVRPPDVPQAMPPPDTAPAPAKAPFPTRLPGGFFVALVSFLKDILKGALK